MTRTVWNAEHGWHETDDDYTLTMTDTGAIQWVNTTEQDTDDE